MPALRELDGSLLRVFYLTSTERVPDGEPYAGLYVFREDDGSISSWSPQPTSTRFAPVETVAEAHGVRFLCPKSFAKNGGPKGTHSVYIFFEGSPHAGHNSAGKEVRWKVTGGTTLDDLQLSPSIQEQDEGMPPERQCNWHGFVGSSGVLPGHAA